MGNWGSDTQSKVLQPVSSRVRKKLNRITTWWLLSINSSLPPPGEHARPHFPFSHSKRGLWTWPLSLNHRTHTENKFQLVFCHWEHLKPSGLYRRDIRFSHNPTGYSQKRILQFPQRSCFLSHTPRELLAAAGTWGGGSFSSVLLKARGKEQHLQRTFRCMAKVTVLLLLVRKTAWLLKYSNKI